VESAADAPAWRAPSLEHRGGGEEAGEEAGGEERRRDGQRSVTTPDVSPAAGELGEDQVRIALRRVKDPELNLNVIDLGLVYTIGVADGDVTIDMSLTSPGCPSGPEIMTGVEEAARSVDGVKNVIVNLIWDPMWTPDRIEPRIRAYLGF